MTVLMSSELPGVTDEGYQHLVALLADALRSSDGFIAHAAGPTDTGYTVTELWESEAAHEAWYSTHVAPAMPPSAPAPRTTYRQITNIVTP